MNDIQLLPINQIKTLLKTSDKICVSIYLSGIRSETEEKQKSIKFDKLLQTAEKELINHGLCPQYAKDFLKPAQQIYEYDFWQYQSDGLAIFISQNHFCYYCLPLNFPELVVVTNRFYLKPLLPIIII